METAKYENFKKEVKEIHVLEKNLDIINLFKKNNPHIKNINYINEEIGRAHV